MARFRSACEDAAVSALFKRHYARSLALARVWLNGSAQAEDAVQEAFVRVVRERRSYDPSRLFLPWYQRILRNVCVDLIRCEERYAQRNALWAMQREAVAAGPGPQSAVPDLIRDLDTSDREVLVLRFVERLSFAQIGVRLGCSEEAAKKRGQRALRRLRRNQRDTEARADRAAQVGQTCREHVTLLPSRPATVRAPG
jgi:DNA-directed RNA polymerase specialized sigma24 family protein